MPEYQLLQLNIFLDLEVMIGAKLFRYIHKSKENMLVMEFHQMIKQHLMFQIPHEDVLQLEVQHL